jgi:hypothetical protein
MRNDKWVYKKAIINSSLVDSPTEYVGAGIVSLLASSLPFIIFATENAAKPHWLDCTWSWILFYLPVLVFLLFFVLPISIAIVSALEHICPEENTARGEGKK